MRCRPSGSIKWPQVFRFISIWRQKSYRAQPPQEVQNLTSLSMPIARLLCKLISKQNTTIRLTVAYMPAREINIFIKILKNYTTITHTMLSSAKHVVLYILKAYDLLESTGFQNRPPHPQF